MKKPICKAAAAAMLAAVLMLMFLCSACASTRIFEDYVPYSLKTFLNGYNLIAFEDAKMNIHCMGGVIVGGNLTTGEWIGFADGDNLPPSYIGGYAQGPVYNSRNSITNAPLYVGPSNTVSSSNGTYQLNGKTTGNNGKTPVYTSTDFISMGEVWNTIVSTAETLRAQCHGKHLYLVGGSADIYIGDYVTVQAEEIPAWELAHGNAYFKGNPAQKVNTVITIEGSGTVKMPTVWLNGSQVNATEVSQDGTSIIWYLPDATRVELGSAPWLGHVIAPNATITMPSGNYNGCLIGRNIDIGSEGHLYNYTADNLPEPDPDLHITPSPTPVITPTPKPDEDLKVTPSPTPVITPTPVPQESLKSYPLHILAHKRIVTEGMPENMPWSFTFRLTSVTQGAPMPKGTVGGAAYATVTSNDPMFLDEYAARFGEIVYTAAGTYVYTLREHDNTPDYFSVDDREYTITVEVTEHSKHQLVALASYSLNGKPADHLRFTNYFLHREWRDGSIPLKGGIELRKIDANTQKPLAGSVFGVYSDPNCTKLYAAMPATNSEGVSILQGLAAGNYYVREKTPIDGYGVNHNTFPVTVESGTIVKVNGGNPITNIPGSGYMAVTKAVENTVTTEDFPFIIKLSKKDVSNVYVLLNGKRSFAISHDLAHDGEALAYLRHGDKLEIMALPTGTEVYISEVTTDLPYEVSINGQKTNSYTGTVDMNAHNLAAFTNTLVLEVPSQSELDAMPATGDHQRLLPWCALLAAAGCLMLLMRRRCC